MKIDRVVALLDGQGDLSVVEHGLAIAPTTVLCVGPGESADPVLKAALALGATRAIRVWDDLLGACDYLGVAHVLSANLRLEVPDLRAASLLILAGDRGRGAVGPAVAERLGLPHLGQVVQIAVRDGRAVVRRREGGIIRLFAAAPPLLLCVVGRPSGSAPSPGAAAGAIETRSLSDLQLTPTELQYRRRFRPKPSPRAPLRPLLLPDASTLAERLRAEGLVRGRGGT